MKVLVTGAAGYIGSVVTEKLVESGKEVIALDNLQNGHRQAVHPEAIFMKGDILDREWLIEFMKANPVEAVLHLAAEALIDESVRDPGRFFRVNVSGGLNLLDAMVISGCNKIVFSSTAAIYGEPQRIPISETDTPKPVNSYGESKLAFERILPWYTKAHKLQHVSLRYFNACGATEKYGEDREVETHLIPVALQAALGKRPALYLYGNDYNTPDGTCIRDYIHVTDIANAHVLALEKIEKISGKAYNMGNSNGYSNLEVIKAVKSITNHEFSIIPSGRRIGDPERLVASSESITKDLGWKPKYPDLYTMVETSWKWKMAHSEGYAD